jgi:hypothetical protein
VIPNNLIDTLASIDRSNDDVPLFRNVFVIQLIVIPTLANRAFKAPIVAGFLLRQSYQCPGIAISKETTPVNLNQKDFAWDKH